MTIETINDPKNMKEERIYFCRAKNKENATGTGFVFKLKGTFEEACNQIADIWRDETEIQILFDREPNAKEAGPWSTIFGMKPEELLEVDRRREWDIPLDNAMGPGNYLTEEYAKKYETMCNELEPEELDEEDMMEEVTKTTEELKQPKNTPFETLKGHITDFLTSASEDAKLAESQANDAYSYADSAEDASDDCRSYIQEAQDALESADGKADDAMDYAKDARTKASEAEINAIDARKNVDKALGLLNQMSDTNEEYRKALIQMANSYCAMLTNLATRFGIRAEGRDLNDFMEVYGLEVSE